jgi:predicted transcriptional regulator
MVDSMSEMLRREMTCESLLECFHGMKAIDREVFDLLAGHEEPLTVDTIADHVDRERSTAYRSVQRLTNAGLVQQEQINYDQGGYYHVYRSADPDRVADEMQRLLNDWYAKMGRLIAEFRETYDGERARTAPAEDYSSD